MNEREFRSWVSRTRIRAIAVILLYLAFVIIPATFLNQAIATANTLEGQSFGRGMIYIGILLWAVLVAAFLFPTYSHFRWLREHLQGKTLDKIPFLPI